MREACCTRGRQRSRTHRSFATLRARETLAYPFSCMPQWLLKPLDRHTPHMCASVPVKWFEQPLRHTREKVRKSVPRSSVSAHAAGAGELSTTLGVRAHTYGTASVPVMCRTPFTASARPLAPGHPTSYACRAVATARGMMRGLHKQPVWIRSVGRAECHYCWTYRISCQSACQDSKGHSEWPWSARKARSEQSCLSQVCNTPPKVGGL